MQIFDDGGNFRATKKGKGRHAAARDALHDQRFLRRFHAHQTEVLFRLQNPESGI